MKRVLGLLALVSATGCIGCGPAVVVDGPGAEGVETQPFVCDVAFPKEGVWRAERGTGTGGTAAQAIDEAQRNARETLLNWAGANLNQLEQGEFKANIDTAWVTPKTRCQRGVCEACAVAFVRKTGVSAEQAVAELKQGLDGRLARFLDDLASGRIAAQRGAAKTPRVRVAVPLWPGSQTAGEAGKLMYTHLWASLGECGPNSSRVPLCKDGADDWDVELTGELTREGTGCALALGYSLKGESSVYPLGSVPFHPKAIGLMECQPPEVTFASDEKMGLRNGRKRGSGGLNVTLEAPTDGGLMCEGVAFNWRVTVSAPAYVRIYSVADDGRVMVAWENPEPVTTWEPAPNARALPLRLGENVHYRLVAVAVPASLGADGFGQRVPGPHCMAALGTGLSTSQLPPEAAVAALTFGVTPAGQRNCPNDSDLLARLQKLYQRLQEVPECRR